MDIVRFNISISPKEAYGILALHMDASLIYREFNNINDEKAYAVLVFEKFYFRAENRAALTVIIDNIDGQTAVKAIPAGSAKGIIFGFDWGAGENFAQSVRKMLEEYII